MTEEEVRAVVRYEIAQFAALLAEEVAEVPLLREGDLGALEWFDALRAAARRHRAGELAEFAP